MNADQGTECTSESVAVACDFAYVVKDVRSIILGLKPLGREVIGRAVLARKAGVGRGDHAGGLMTFGWNSRRLPPRTVPLLGQIGEIGGLVHPIGHVVRVELGTDVETRP